MAVDLTRQPAQQTSIGNQGFALLPGSTAPDRGLILRSNPYSQPKDSARVLTNLRWDGAAWTTKLMGNAYMRGSTFNSGSAFKDFGIHWVLDGSAKHIQQVGKQVQLYSPLLSGAVESVLFTAALETIPSMRSFSPAYFLYANGCDPPQKWDGTTWAPCENWPVAPGGGTILTTPKYVEIFQYRAVYSGFPQDPYGVLLSDFGAPSTFSLTGTGDAIGGYYRVPTQCGPVTAVHSFKISQQSNQELLLIGCRNGLIMLTGTGAGNFQFVPLTKRFGVISHRAWMELDSDLYVLCTDGVRRLQGNAAFSNLVNSALSYPVQPLTIGLAKATNWEQAFVVDNPDYLESHWYFSNGVDNRNRSCIYMNYSDIESGGVARFAKRQYPPQFAGAVSLPSCATTYSGVIMTGDYNGYLRKEWTGNTWADGTGIDWRYVSPHFDSPTPAQEASARGFWIICRGSSNHFRARARRYTTIASDNTFIRDFSDTDSTLGSNLLNQCQLGKWPLGEIPFEGLPEYEIFEYDPGAAGRGWALDLSGNTVSSGGGFNFLGVFSTLIGGGTRQ